MLPSLPCSPRESVADAAAFSTSIHSPHWLAAADRALSTILELYEG